MIGRQERKFTEVRAEFTNEIEKLLAGIRAVKLTAQLDKIDLERQLQSVQESKQQLEGENLI